MPIFYLGQMDYIEKLNGLSDGTTAHSALLVGVGVSWAGTMEATTGSGAIQVGDRNTIQAATSGNMLLHNANCRYDGANWKYIETAIAFSYLIDPANDWFAWYRAPSGTAGTTVSFIELMRLNSTGLGIGIAPIGTNRLTVNHSANINFGIGGAVSLAGAVSLTGVNDANSVNIPVEFRASKWAFFAGTGVGIGVDPAHQLHLYGDDQTFKIEQNAGLAGSTTIWLTSAGGANFEALRLGSGGYLYARTDASNILHFGPDTVAANAWAKIYSPAVNSGAILLHANVANGGSAFSEVLFGNNSTNTRAYVSYSHSAEAITFGSGSANRAILGSAGLYVLNATGAAVADSVSFYSTDDAPGHTIPSFYCEGTNVLATGQADSTSSVRVKMRVNGTVVTLLGI